MWIWSEIYVEMPRKNHQSVLVSDHLHPSLYEFWRNWNINKLQAPAKLKAGSERLYITQLIHQDSKQAGSERLCQTPDPPRLKTGREKLYAKHLNNRAVKIHLHQRMILSSSNNIAAASIIGILCWNQLVIIEGISPTTNPPLLLIHPTLLTTNLPHSLLSHPTLLTTTLLTYNSPTHSFTQQYSLNEWLKQCVNKQFDFFQKRNYYTASKNYEDRVVQITYHHHKWHLCHNSQQTPIIY